MPCLRSDAKAVWYFLTFSGFSYYLWDITSLYMRYETITNFELKSGGVEPPSISLCYHLFYFKNHTSFRHLCQRSGLWNCLSSQPINLVLKTYPGIEAIIKTTLIDNKVINYTVREYYKDRFKCFQLNIRKDLSLSR